MINSRGQVLVIFVILLPIFLIIITGLVDIGLLNYNKKKLDSNTYDAVEYYLDNFTDEIVIDKTKALLNKNLKDIDITINDSSETVTIKVTKEYKSIYSVIRNSDKITIRYIGNKETKEIKKG